MLYSWKDLDLMIRKYKKIRQNNEKIKIKLTAHYTKCKFRLVSHKILDPIA